MPSQRRSAVRIKRHVERITSKKHRYAINVKGSRDPENHCIVIENAGKTYVEKPRVRANGRSDWFDKDTMVRDTVRGFRTDEEKAIALCYLFDGTRFQRSQADRRALNPVILLGAYGYGICGHTAPSLKVLAERAGMKARYWEINHHTITEIFFDGAWHMLDGNVPVFYLKRDNRTIASLADLQKDADLIGRTQPLGGRDHSKFRPWYTTKEYHHRHDGYDAESLAEYDLGLVLRPGERFERFWKPVLHKYHDRANRPDPPQRYANGRLVFTPDLAKVDLNDLVGKGLLRVRNLKSTKRQSPRLRVEKPQDAVFDLASRVVLTTKSPYAIVGGTLRLAMRREGSAERDNLDVELRALDKDDIRRTIYKAVNTGAFDVELDLDGPLEPWGKPARTGYEVTVLLRADAETDPPGLAGLDELALETHLQVAPLALPALIRGENTIEYADGTRGPHDVRVIHVWIERSGGEPPQAPVKLTPTRGEKLDTLAPTLEWQQPEGTKRIVDYQLLVSRWKHGRLPHCPNLYGSIRRNFTYFNVPLGWLATGTTYYWKVRALDDAGDWGPWSEVALFRTNA